MIRKLLASTSILATLGATALHANTFPEVEDLTLGFIKLTDMAPLAIAYERGYFEDEGLFVTLEAQANWKVLLDGVIDGNLHGAHMLAGQPLAATIGFGTEAHIVTPFVMDLNGNATTVSNEVWDMMRPAIPADADGKPVHPISAEALRPAIEVFADQGRPFNMGMVFPVSTHNFELRYWLAAGGIHPGFYSTDNISGQIGAEAQLSVTPPPQMPATLEAGTISGYSVGEPWNQQAVAMGIGVPVITDLDIFPMRAEKVLGLRADFVEENPNTVRALTRALIRATIWLDADDHANREEAVQIISRPTYVGADPDVLRNSMTGTFEYEQGDIRSVPEFNVFSRYYANYPFTSDAVWYLTQMRRWGQISDAQTDDWYAEVAQSVFLSDLFMDAALSLVDDGFAPSEMFPFGSDGYRDAVDHAIDGVLFDGRTPNAYIDSLPIGLKGAQVVVGTEVQG